MTATLSTRPSLPTPLAVVAGALRVICAWCPTFDPHAADNAGASHGICPPCLDRMMLTFNVPHVIM